MGQSATLYRIDRHDFPGIKDNSEDLIVREIAKGYTTFEKSFEGLRFVLSKNQHEQETELVQQIFYPESFVGEAIDFESIDLNNIPDDFNFDSTAIYYHEPSNVSRIAAFLETISIEKFKTLFDPDELNEEGIYPGDIWNRETGEDIGFNELHMVEEFANLKALFKIAADEGDYVFCFVG